MTIKAIIADDEEYGRDNLKNLIDQYCNNIEIVAIAASVASARKMIKSYKPDVVFLDIQMPGENGFELINKLADETSKPYIVFVTAYNQFAIKAIKAQAFDYILKPIDIDELMRCEVRLMQALNPHLKNEANAPVQEEPTPIDVNGKISISHSRGIKVLHLNSILYFEADKNYTIIHIRSELKNGAHEKFVVSRNLGYYEHFLPANLFFRVHYSFIINVDYVKDYVNTNNGSVIMENGAVIELSRRRSGPFRQFLKDHNKI